MKKWTRRILRGLIGMFFVFSLAFAIVLLSVLSNINGANYSTILGEVAFEEFEKQLENQGSSTDDVYLFLEPACQGQDSITVSQGIQLNCDEVVGEDQEVVEEFIKKELSKQLEVQIENELTNTGQSILGIKFHTFERLFSLLNRFMIMFFISSFVFLTLLIIVESPKHKSFSHLGGTGIAIGFPFIFIKQIDIGLDFEGSQILSSIIDSVFNSLYYNLLFLFIVGILLLITGIILGIHYKKKESGKVLNTKKGT